MNDTQKQSHFRLSCDDLNWTIQKLERTGAGKIRWKNIKWYGENLSLCLSHLQGLWTRELFHPDQSLMSLVEALEGSRKLLCQETAQRLIAEGRFKDPRTPEGPRGAAPTRGTTFRSCSGTHA